MKQIKSQTILIEIAITIQLVEAESNAEDREKLYTFKPNTY